MVAGEGYRRAMAQATGDPEETIGINPDLAAIANGRPQ